MTYRLLTAFRDAFAGRQYIHRNQAIGNFIASHLYEDLLMLGRSPKLNQRVQAGQAGVNTANLVKGKRGRRGDGTFGDLIPGELPRAETGFVVPRGPLATILIGAEMKILAKAMLKQIDRVMNDLVHQAETFHFQAQHAITVAIVGVNFSSDYTSYEGNRRYPADVPPAREAPTAVDRIHGTVASKFDELLLLRFRATNVPPYPFEWVDEKDTTQTYAAALLRISDIFERRF